MAANELAFELFGLALEATRGTAITPPTHLLNMTGTLTPNVEVYSPPDQVGVLAEANREEIVRQWAEWEAEGGADVTKLPLLLNMAMAPLTTGIAAGGEVTGTTSLVGGSGYSSSFYLTVGAPAAGGRQAVIRATATAGVVTALTIEDPGQNYTSAPALTFTPGGGTGASATAVAVAAAA